MFVKKGNVAVLTARRNPLAPSSAPQTEEPHPPKRTLEFRQLVLTRWQMWYAP